MYDEVVKVLRSEYNWPLDCAPAPKAVAKALETETPGDVASALDAWCWSQAERTEALNRIAETVPAYYDRPLYGTWAATPPALPPNCGPTSWCGCASGIGTWPPKIDVSQRLGRVEQLVSWEITNAFLGSIRRPDLWDNAYVSSVVSRVGQQIGGWSQ